MKYLDFKNENVYLGHDKYLMEEFSGHSLFFFRNLSSSKKCDANDTAANQIPLFMAMKYANARSIRYGLKPYYNFEDSPYNYIEIIRESNSRFKYLIGYHDFGSNVKKRFLLQ